MRSVGGTKHEQFLSILLVQCSSAIAVIQKLSDQPYLPLLKGKINTNSKLIQFYTN